MAITHAAYVVFRTLTVRIKMSGRSTLMISFRHHQVKHYTPYPHTHIPIKIAGASSSLLSKL